jgi:hypothetical protein
MLRSLFSGLACVFVLSACGSPPAPTEQETRQVIAELANCGLPGSRWDTCDVLIVHKDGSIVRIGGFDSELRPMATTDDRTHVAYDDWLFERFGVVFYLDQIEAIVPRGTIRTPDGTRYDHTVVEARYEQRLIQH